jgi:hypothetical protein
LPLLLAGPALAAEPSATAAQLKDIHALQKVFGRCSNAEDYDPNIRKACLRSRKLQARLVAQGFCFYRQIEVGRVNKDKKCRPLPGGPPL